MVVNSINGKISVSKDIVNLMEDVRRLLVLFRGSRVGCCSKVINGELDMLAKTANLQRFLLYPIFCD